ncbi:GyrI-like domain-containing protein [Brevibacterium litoralis]|uniref:GyrI-like domain-containing protein n=1 Tax=Brevibacterium litoralis TaxID=3138935 RepID=UPI0032EF5596
MAHAKVDLKKELDEYAAPKGLFREVVVPVRHYLMIDGRGDPNTSPAFDSALQVLYPLAYALKFHSKKELGRDYVVPPLEGLWWADDMDAFTSGRDKSCWDWTLMLLVPDWLGAAEVAVARDVVARKAGPAAAGAGVSMGEGASAEECVSAGPAEVRFEELDEGLCVQTLHVGSFDAEGPVLERMHHEYIPDHDLEMTGTHHEVYFSDTRRTAPEKLRTLLRQPVRRV